MPAREWGIADVRSAGQYDVIDQLHDGKRNWMRRYEFDCLYRRSIDIGGKHDSHEKNYSRDNERCTCIGNDGMVGERTNATVGRSKLAYAAKERHADRNRGLQRQG
jgi:hypothetical protein